MSFLPIFDCIEYRDMRLYFTLILAGLIAFGAGAQQEEFVRALGENAQGLKFEPGNPAYSLLTEAISSSQFTLIGEAHGLAEVQSVSAELYKIGAGHGYSAMVIETDPFSAAKVAQMAQSDDAETTDFASKYAMAIPFFHSEEGMAFAREIVSMGASLWGVDQVFVVGPRYLFAKLAKAANSPEANKLAAEYADRAQDLFNEAMSSGNPGGVLLMKLTDDEFDELRTAFSDVPSAQELIDQMQLSRDIYQYWYDGEYYLNNSVRSDLMKRLFLKAIQ